jgi:hypothetical protein
MLDVRPAELLQTAEVQGHVYPSQSLIVPLHYPTTTSKLSLTREIGWRERRLGRLQRVHQRRARDSV